MCGLKDSDITVVFMSLVMILLSGKQVGFYVLGTGLVVECEVVLRKLGDPAGLSSVQLLRESEILEVLVIHPDFYVFFGTHEVMTPFGEGEHDC